MFQAMYILAFYAFLKVGEFTLSHGQADNLLQFHQIMLDADRKAIQVAFHRYKHSKGKQYVSSIHSGGEHDILSCGNNTMQAQGAHAIPDTFPIDAPVTDSLKQHIWSNEFIDLSQLLKPHSEPEHFNITMSSGLACLPCVCFPRNDKAFRQLISGTPLSRYSCPCI